MTIAALHLLYVFPEPLPLNRARGVQVAQFVRALAGQGVKVTLAYVPAAHGQPFAPLGSDVPAGVTLLPLSRQLPGILGRLPLKSHRLFMWRLTTWLRRAQRSASAPDMAFFRHVKAAAWFSEQFPEIPLAYEAHEVFALTAKASQRQRLSGLEKSVLERARLVVANSHGSAEGLLQTHGLQRRIDVMPNGVAFPATVADKDWREAPSRIVYAGSLFGWKGVDDLVDACNELPGCRVEIIGGSGEQIERLRQRHKPGGGTIEFLGHKPHHEVQRHLEGACVAVLPNRPDRDSQFTSPLKLFEYLAYGCVVVATDLPAMREVLSENGAFWAQPGNPASLAAAIRGAASADPQVLAALGQRGRELVQARTWERRAADFVAAACAVLADKEGGR